MAELADIFMRLVEVGPDVLFRYRLEPELTCEYVSPSVEALLGYTPDALRADPRLGMNVLFPESRSALEEVFENPSTAATLRHDTYVGRCRRRDGSEAWIELHFHPIYDDRGALTAIEGLARDVTERRRMEEQVRASEELFRRLFEGFPLGLAFTDPRQQFTRINPALARMLGYAADEMIGRTGFDFTHPDDVANSAEQIRLLGPGGAPSIRMDKRYLGKDGHVVHARTTVLPVFGDSGNFLYALVVIEDVSKQRELETALAAAREAELARRVEEARLEGVFLTVRESAHALGNALSNASGYNELALNRPGLTPEIRDLLEYARGGLDTAIEYMANLQRVVRVQTKQTPVGPALDVPRSISTTE